jgi:hypothetical protein
LQTFRILILLVPKARIKAQEALDKRLLMGQITPAFLGKGSTMNSISEQELRQKLTAEVDQAPWSALVRHFAFGRVYIVRTPWNLIDAAIALHKDAKSEVETALKQKFLEQPSDAEAQAWTESSARFDVLVISPFVLIQAPR